MGGVVALGSVIADKYHLDAVIGEGGMGVVVRATHLLLNQPVAIKFLRQEAMSNREAVRQFVTEAQAAARVHGEHVVRVHDVALLEDGTPYIVMEYLEGVSLARILEDRGALPFPESVRYAAEICEALVQTHQAGIVHRDLKPDNIFVAGGGDTPRRIKLLDFGVSRLLEGGGPLGETIVGTPSYMSPEQFRSRGDVRSDLWAVGIVLYEMLNGLPPFSAETVDETRLQIESHRHPALMRADVPGGLKDIIDRCLEKEPERRFASAREIADALEDYLPIESSIDRIQRRAKPAQNSGSLRSMAPTVIVSNRRRGQGTWSLAALGLFGVIGIVVTLVIAHNYRPAALTDTARATTPPTPPISQAPPAHPPPASETAPLPARTEPPSTARPVVTVPRRVLPPRRAPRVPTTTTTTTTDSHESAAGPAPYSSFAPAPPPSASPAADDDRFGTRK